MKSAAATQRLHIAYSPGAIPTLEQGLQEHAIRAAQGLFEKHGTAIVQQSKSYFSGYLHAFLGLPTRAALDPTVLATLRQLPQEAVSAPAQSGDETATPQRPHSARLIFAQLLYIAHGGRDAFDAKSDFNQLAFCTFLLEQLGQERAAAIHAPAAKPILQAAAEDYLRGLPGIRFEQVHEGALTVTLTDATHQVALDIPLRAPLTELDDNLLEKIACYLPMRQRGALFGSTKRFTRVGRMHWSKFGEFNSPADMENFCRRRYGEKVAPKDNGSIVQDLKLYLEKGWVRGGDCPAIEKAILTTRNASFPRISILKGLSGEGYPAIEEETVLATYNESDLAHLSTLKVLSRDALRKLQEMPGKAKYFLMPSALCALACGYQSDIEIAAKFESHHFEEGFSQQLQAILDNTKATSQERDEQIDIISDLPFVRSFSSPLVWHNDTLAFVKAIEEDNQEFVSVFLKACDRMRPFPVVPKKLFPALKYVIEKDNLELFTHLRDHGYIRKKMRGPIREIGDPSLIRHNATTTPFMMALQYGAKKIAHFMLEEGIDMHAKDDSGNTPLHILAVTKRFDDDDVLWESILRGGGEADALNDEDISPLKTAARRGEFGLFERLFNSLKHDPPRLKKALFLGDATEAWTWPITEIFSNKDLASEVITLLRRQDLGLEEDVPLLHIASYCADFRSIDLLLQMGDDPTTFSRCGRTSLHYLFRLEDEDIDVWEEESDVARCLARLQEAIKHPESAEVKAWINALIPIDPCHPVVETFPALQGACRRGWDTLCKQLVAAGANPLILGSRGSSLLHDAQAACIPWLLDLGCQLDQPNIAGKTPLHAALERQDEGAVRELIRRGASLSAETCRGETSVDFLAEHMQPVLGELISDGTISLETHNSRGTTPLFRACIHRNARAISNLIKHGANVNSENGPDRNRPLHAFLLSDQKWCDRRALELLLGNPQSQIRVPNRRGYHPFHLAVMGGNRDIVQMFLQSNRVSTEDAAPFNKFIDGCTPLHLACLFGHADIVDMLLKHGASLFALACARKQVSPEVQSEVQVGEALVHSINALHCAILSKKIEVVQALLKHPSVALLLTAPRPTPLDLARSKDPAIARLLEAAYRKAGVPFAQAVAPLPVTSTAKRGRDEGPDKGPENGATPAAKEQRTK